ncbi:unnamed protein product [Zymoseptoria tritici ST99CH_1A5]|nr:unnamed protein product [Zymoseptoria tritici ST99CH_1A5]
MKFPTHLLLFAISLAFPLIQANCPGPGAYCVDTTDGCCPGMQCLYDRGRSRCHSPCGNTGGWCPRGQKCYTANDNKTILCLNCIKHGGYCTADTDCCNGNCIGLKCVRKPKPPLGERDSA